MNLDSLDDFDGLAVVCNEHAAGATEMCIAYDRKYRECVIDFCKKRNFEMPERDIYCSYYMAPKYYPSGRQSDQVKDDFVRAILCGFRKQLSQELGALNKPFNPWDIMFPDGRNKKPKQVFDNHFTNLANFKIFTPEEIEELKKVVGRTVMDTEKIDNAINDFYASKGLFFPTDKDIEAFEEKYKDNEVFNTQESAKFMTALKNGVSAYDARSPLHSYLEILARDCLDRYSTNNMTR